MVDGGTPALNRSRETRAQTQSGYLMLLVWLLVQRGSPSINHLTLRLDIKMISYLYRFCGWSIGFGWTRRNAHVGPDGAPTSFAKFFASKSGQRRI